MQQNAKKILKLIFLFLGATAFNVSAQKTTVPKPLRLGYSIDIKKITPETMQYAKANGIDCIEIAGINGLIDKNNRRFKGSDEEVADLFASVKKTADDVGIIIWSVHMPYSDSMDISLPNELSRRKVVALHKKIIELSKVLQPAIILFHPSYYLGLNERDVRKKQMIESAIALNEYVKAAKASMVIENMLGPELLKDEKRERPLCRTVDEAVEIMNLLPADIYSAIDMNHIKNPERLILAMGERLKSVHVADGTGEEENHYFPCSGQGQNDWVSILSALDKARYTGPFMYECHYKDVADMKGCYESLYKSFINEKYKTAAN